MFVGMLQKYMYFLKKTSLSQLLLRAFQSLQMRQLFYSLIFAACVEASRATPPRVIIFALGDDYGGHILGICVCILSRRCAYNRNFDVHRPLQALIMWGTRTDHCRRVTQR